ncbi:MAG TPA: hypothetical protein VKN36_05345 [Eudoraea sp.]|nr:hypothetical protein [Eudoraea sp.]
MQKEILLLLSLFIWSCQKSVDFETEKKKIQAQIDLVDRAHESKDAIQFYQPNTESWYDVRQGTVTLVKKSDMINSTQSYLDKMVIQEMTKRDDPIIEISDDGTLASYIGSVTVKGILAGTPLYWVVSWQSVLKKINGEWKIISSANTEADKRTSAIVLLNQIRENLGSPTDNTSIYAYAQCKAPERSFQTLVLSSKTDGRLEQIYDKRHFILKHGIGSSWTYDLNTKSLKEDMDISVKESIYGHELHWLSFWPEHRYLDPVLLSITEFMNQTAFNIEFKDGMSRSINFYYSFDTYIPLGYESQLDDKGGKVSVHFEDWEKIEGISFFKRAILHHGDEIFEYDFVDIKMNQLDSQDFENKIGLIN